MAHLRSRHIVAPFEQLLKFARITGVIGHRQTGKSTFVEAHSSEYLTLDDRETLRRAQADPKKFVDELKARSSAIDECQLAPELFPALKLKIGTSSIPGRFILTGSVRFSSRNAIRESLAGRIINQELLPLVLTELAELPNIETVKRLLDARFLKAGISEIRQVGSVFRQNKKLIETYLRFGGLPTVCFVRSPKSRKAILRDILETILDRDVRLVYPTTVPLEQIRELCRMIAASPMDSLSYQEIRRQIGLAPATSKKLIQAMESVFLIRRIQQLGDTRGEVFWFEDQLERHFFAGDEITTADWIGLLYRNIRAQFTYRVGEMVEFFQYRTRGGALVPLIIRSRERSLGFFVVPRRADISRSMLASAESFLNKFENARVIFALSEDNEAEALTDRMGVVPLGALVLG